MRYAEFISSVEEACSKDDMVLRALGMTASIERFKFRSREIAGLPQPIIAVLSSPENVPRDRNYNILTTHTKELTPDTRQYPLVRLSAQILPSLGPDDFIGDFDPALSDRLVSLNVTGETLVTPVNVWYLEGNIGSLVVNSLPTYPLEVSEALDKLY
jgi:hypothetical protein